MTMPKSIRVLMPPLRYVNTSDPDTLDDAIDGMIESPAQRLVRLQGQLRQDFEHKRKKEKQNDKANKPPH